METVAQSPAHDELQLLTSWGAAEDASRRRSAGVLSILIHAAVIVAILLFPSSLLQPPHPADRHVTPLVEPLTEPTQTAANKGKLGKEFNAETMQPRPRIQVPPSPPSTTRPAAPTPALPPVEARRTPAPPPVLPEPPKVETTAQETPKLPLVVPPPPPQIQPQEVKPKSPFESPTAQAPVQAGGVGRVAAPSTSVTDAIRGVVRGGASGGLVLGDTGSGVGGIGEGVNLPPSPGAQGSSLELLSDPMGVDFRPYLIKILAAVRRNWWAVMPEAARLGRRGRVGIQFAVARNGSVPKLVIVSSSGTDALDRAAVAGVSASNPFPPLPTDYKGDQIRLQFNFAYNIPKQ